MQIRNAIVLCTGIFLFSVISVSAKITRIEILKTEIYKNGQKFGEIGAYEKLTGLVYGEVDPSTSLNSIIQDIELAPSNTNGNVEYISEIIILRPVKRENNNGVLFLSLPNRGNVFPVDDYYLSRGYMVLWTAWQGDVLSGNNRVTLKVPVATKKGETIIGTHRAEYQVRKQTATLPLGFGYYNGNSHHSYLTASLDNSTAVLTRRVREADEKTEILKSEWAFSDCSKTEFPGTPDAGKISVIGGFDSKYLYELIYQAKDPLVLGLGLAVIRDVTSFLKNETADSFGNSNPFLTDDNKNPLKTALMQGVSQCGLFTRTFIHLGFNQDENGKIVFEGVNPHIGPRRISLNIRFARPGGGGAQRNDHTFPSFEPPFTWGITHDPHSGITGGLLERCISSNTCPKIIQTFSSSEYWQLRASQRTTDALGQQDIKIHPNVRIYLFAGTQHSAFSYPDPVSGFQTNGNPYNLQLRALIVALEKWVLKDIEPPASSYPRIGDNSLVLPENLNWPTIPEVNYNAVINKGNLLNFGPKYNIKDVSGILSEPPVEIEGKEYPILVPQVNSDGNEIGGVQNINQQVPLGTYTGWSLCLEQFGEGDLNGLNGMFIPFKKTKENRLADKDPRLSIEERYGSHSKYVELVKIAAKKLVENGFLLQKDANAKIKKAEESDVLK